MSKPVTPVVKMFRMAENGVEPTEENMNAGNLEFWGKLESGKEIRLYYFDEDKPTPEGYIPVRIKKGIMPVQFVAKIDEL